jgi:hypothetical protein
MAIDRRLLGVALLAVLVAAGSIAHAVAGWQTPGTAVTAPPPAEPVTGTCLGRMTDDVQLAAPVDMVQAVPCADPHSSEIFFVGSLVGSDYPFRADRELIGTAEMQRAQRVCHDKARRYLGEFEDNARWRVAPRTYTKVSVPSRAAWGLGQRWFTCQVVPDVHDGPIEFAGTIAGARAAVHPPAILGTCANAVGGAVMTCTAPHLTEQLTDAPAPRTFRVLKSEDVPSRPSCMALAATIIGTSDPTFGGQLLITDHQEVLAQSCWAESANGTPLVESLIGHGAAPLAHG